MRLLQSTLHDTSRSFVVTRDQLTADNGCTDDFGGVDNLLDTWYTKSDIHRGDAGEVESLKRHLRTGLTN